MEYLPGGLTLTLCEGAFPLSTDTVALQGFVKLPKNARVLDLGSGCGTLGLFLCAQNADCTVQGIELQEKDHRQALRNIAHNGLSSRLNSICADLQTIPAIFPSGSFSCCVSNPPYFSGGFLSSRTPQARSQEALSTEELFQAAAWATQYGGDFFLVHKPEYLAQLCAQADKSGFAVKELCLVHHRQGGPVSTVLLRCRKGGKPGLKLWEEYLFDAQENPTPYYRSLYHFQEA